MDAVDRAKYFKKDIAKQMRDLPEPGEITIARQTENHQRKMDLEAAFDEETAHEGFWQWGRLQNDASVEAARHITDGEDPTIYLPEETSKFSSSFKEFRPQNAIKFKLPKDIARQVRQNVRNRNASTPDEIFKAAYEILHGTGWASHGKRSTAYKAPKTKTRKQEARKPKTSTAAQITVRAGMFPSR